MAVAGASKPCSPTSNRAASALRTLISTTPSASTACCSSWLWPFIGPSPPDCGTLVIIQLPVKKRPETSAQESRARQNLLVHPRHPAHRQNPPGLPALTSSVGGLGN